eukprot:CAMPEP_0171235502 /NCGR_PEP_ID=MMETSP0790-20130122/41976_1 /TAXON_ID=2925 /ORGANISM="Alexandrium catenella, Strain OF101" /LENGTH=182 /DNA_ID=CAMNT_0011701809 /DNA_START=57 /DNA_END=601 /DNA_ORIENTATION=+
MRIVAGSLFAALCWAGALAEDRLVGEHGQAVLGCACKGGKGTHGYCGYHFHLGSQEAKPWCRTKFSCGKSGLQGSWAYCDAKGVERRRAQDGQLYTSKEFKEFYGKEGRDAWVTAAPYPERRLAGNQQAYNAFEFRDHYVDSWGEEGWIPMWTDAKPEARQAKDGKWWTWDEYVQFYGDKEA